MHGPAAELKQHPSASRCAHRVVRHAWVRIASTSRRSGRPAALSLRRNRRTRNALRDPGLASNGPPDGDSVARAEFPPAIAAAGEQPDAAPRSLVAPIADLAAYAPLIARCPYRRNPCHPPDSTDIWPGEQQEYLGPPVAVEVMHAAEQVARWVEVAGSACLGVPTLATAVEMFRHRLRQPVIGLP